MIDEKELIEQIKSLRVTITGLRAWESILKEYAQHFKDSVIKIIDEQQKVDEWIPVEERLPKIGENVLVTCLYSNEVDFGFYCGNCWVLDYTDDEAYPVIAWMPLPKPYKKEKTL